jgi:hypothetical protein
VLDTALLLSVVLLVASFAFIAQGLPYPVAINANLLR